MKEPGYLNLFESGELARRSERLMEMLGCCRICPRDCDVNRLKDEVAACYSGLLPIVSTYTAHFGEEPALVGTRGAGNVFLGLCNLRCVYCQNYQISQTFKEQRKNEVTFERLADIYLELQGQGCHNINWVSPTHFVPQLVKSLLMAAERGLKLPVVFNTNSYDSVEVLRLLDGIVDVYLPDLKYSEDEVGREYSKVTEYVRHSRAALKETPDPAWSTTWTLKHGTNTLWTAPRNVVVRNHLNHLIHHRAQLTVYLRLLDVPVPATYGPSADERTF